MIEWFCSLAPVWQALAASLFMWAMTAAGAATVFFFGSTNKYIMPWMIGIAAGVMTAASFWSLLLPAAEMCGELGFSEPAGFLHILCTITDKTEPILKRKNFRKRQCRYLS